MRKATVYSLFGFLWVLAAAGGFIVVVSGNAEPYVSPDLVPEPRVAYWGGAAAAVAIPGLVTSRLLKRRAWAGMGRRVGLSGGGGLLGYPDMTGTHRGRTVRVRTDTRRKSSSGEGGSKKVTVTIIEAMLDHEAERGIMLAHADRGRSRAGPKVDLQKDGSVSVANVAGTGPSTAAVEAVATPAVQAAMDECEHHGLVLAGNAAAELRRQAAAERQTREMDGLGGKLAGWMAEKAAEGLKDNPVSVSTELQYLLLDPAALERQLDLVVTVADEFEAAMGDAAEAK